MRDFNLYLSEIRTRVNEKRRELSMEVEEKHKRGVGEVEWLRVVRVQLML